MGLRLQPVLCAGEKKRLKSLLQAEDLVVTTSVVSLTSPRLTRARSSGPDDESDQVLRRGAAELRLAGGILKVTRGYENILEIDIKGVIPELAGGAERHRFSHDLALCFLGGF
jgi:hypothetical protein